MTSLASTGGGEEGGGGTPEQPPAQQQGPHPPPSPLSGCYLLVVLPEPHTAQHKDLILNRLAKGFLSWDKDSCHVDLEKELQALVAQSPEGEEARNGERLIQYATENLVTEVLIYPQSNTLLQCIRNLLASFTKHRHIIHAGYTFGGNGSWILQDGTFSLADFLDAFSEHEVQRVLRAYENSVTVDIHCAGVGDWTTARLSKEPCTRACRVRVNPDDVLTAGVPAITSFTNYIGQYLIAQTLDQLMEPSDVVGNIRFSHPTLYVFPGGQGDAALFGINGFNMLVDGGFARKACFWDFARHLDRLDAVLVTRINNSNVGGMSSVLRKKKETHVYPQIGHFFCNLVERRHSNSPDGDKDIDPLILNLIDMGQEMMVNLRHINLRPHPCYRDPEPINLYHKVGHGTLDMYVLSPSKDSREVREFMSKWNTSDSKLFTGLHRKDMNSIIFPVQNLVSICAMLVWKPANPEDTITRILFPGSTPQHKIFEGFERLRNLEFLKHPVCTAKSLSPSSSLVTLKDKSAILKPKLSSIERETKRLAEIRKEKKDVSEMKAVKKDIVDDVPAKIPTGKPAAFPQPKQETKAKKVIENRKVESEVKESKKIEKELKENKKEVKKIEKSERPELETKKTDAVKVETEKTAPVKDPKIQKTEPKKRESKEITKLVIKPSKPEGTIKPSIKSIEKKSKSSEEKKDIMKASPTTPKKSMNGIATKTEISKTSVKSTIKTTSRISSSAPAKSAKDANNRMVVEQKNIELSSMASSASSMTGTKAPAAKVKTTERKPISRRTKPVSPSKARLPISPAKSTRSTPTSVKSEKDAVIRRFKAGTTDSSAVSTPSGVETEPAMKLIDKNLTEKSEDMSLDSIESKVLADLKEEREVVEEIEAVLQKAELIEGVRKGERFEGDEDLIGGTVDKKEEDMTEEDVTAEMEDMPKKIQRKESQELTEEDEYLIVEKEEIYTEDSVQSGDAEQKHQLDEVESEKIRTRIEKEPREEEIEHEEQELAEEKKDEVPEKKLIESTTDKEFKSAELAPEHKELLKEEMKQIITFAAETVGKTEEKDESGKRDSDDVTKEPSSSSLDKLIKPDTDKKEILVEKLEESQERISTLESGATTTAPTLPEDERVPLDEIKEDIDEKHTVEEIEEKNGPELEEIIPEILPVLPKPEVKELNVRSSTQHGVHRDVVKTPDEVADLPVHEEVDPKLYRIDDPEKDKETKMTAVTQAPKEAAAPPVKEQKEKGVFSFFGKVADKFEKGIDKLTKKTRRDSEKDTEDKSSKSSSPKEPKPQSSAVFEVMDADKIFPKVGQNDLEKLAFEQVRPEISDIRTAAIKETASFLQEEIKEHSKNEIENQFVEETTMVQPPNNSDNVKFLKDEMIDNLEEIEAFVKETSGKFQNVKDSLQDSLESLIDKVDDAEKKSKDIADTLSGVAEKLESAESFSDFIDSKEPEKVKFSIPSNEDLEDDDSDGVVRDIKEAVRDVAGVLVGTAGIEIEKEEKPKDVEEIVKKVAEVLKDDNFLTKETLFTEAGSRKDDDDDSKLQDGGTILLEKLSATENLDLETNIEVDEELCTEVKTSEVSRISPVRDAKADKEDVKRICEELLSLDDIEKPEIEVKTETRIDVMDAGLEIVCKKEIAKREVWDENIEEGEKVVLESEISFDQKLSPGKAELVTVTPGSTPTSPKVTAELGLPELPVVCKEILDKDTNLEIIMEEFIVNKKQQITTQTLEYITIVKRVPKQKIIHIILNIIIKYNISRKNIADDMRILRMPSDITPDQRLKVENHILNEYCNKNKKLTSTDVDKISTENHVSKYSVIEMIEEIMIDKAIPRESMLDITEELYLTLLKEDIESMSEKVKKEEHVFNQHSIVEGPSLNTEPNVDKIVDDFSSISSRDVAKFAEKEQKPSQDESKIVDDFEVVKPEYKIRDVSETLSSGSSADYGSKDAKVVSEGMSNVIEVDEKFVNETVEKTAKEAGTTSEISKENFSKTFRSEESQDVRVSEESDMDTKEKYLDEEKEKPSDEEIMSLQELTQESQEKTVRRMVVTASSEDGGHETEICPTGTITFTKSPTPEDSLRETDVKSTPEKDSLMLDRDSLRSVSSTPEKDSIASDKSERSDEKATPEDSLDKSPSTAAKTQVDERKPEISPEQLPEKPEDASPAESVFFKSIGDQIPEKTVVSDDIKYSLTEVESLEKVERPDLPSIERDILDKDLSPEKTVDSGSRKQSITGSIHSEKAEDRSKSPSAEKEVCQKEPSPDKSITSDSRKQSTAGVTPVNDDVRSSKSPSVERDIHDKESSPEKTVISDSRKPSVAGSIHSDRAGERSKSPSAEKELSHKEPSPVKSITSDSRKQSTVDVTHIGGVDGSKSPSIEKDILDEDPSPERMVISESRKQSIAGSLDSDEAKVKSKSLSAEQEINQNEPSPDKSITSNSRKQSTAGVTPVNDDVRTSKSPSVERDIHNKESSPDKTVVSDSRKQSVTGSIHPDEAVERSKSPSAEKDLSEKEPSPEKSITSDSRKQSTVGVTPLEGIGESKSPSVEKDILDKDPTPDKAIVPDSRKQSVTGSIQLDRTEDRSKSPSVEKEVGQKEPSPNKSITSDSRKQSTIDLIPLDGDIEKQKSPSLERDVVDKESSPEKTVVSDSRKQSVTGSIHPDEAVERTKSPSAEKEICQKELSPDKLIASDSRKPSTVDGLHLDDDVGKHLYPNFEKDLHEKETSPDKSVVSDSRKQSIAGSIHSDKTGDRSPSAEKELSQKEPSPEKSITSDSRKESTVEISPSVGIGKIGSSNIKENVPDKGPSSDKSVLSDSRKQSITESIHSDRAEGRSKSPSAEKEISQKEPSSDKLIIFDSRKPSTADAHSSNEDVDQTKALHLEKDIHDKEPTPEKSVVSDSRKQSIAGSIHSDKVEERSKSPSAEKELSQKEPSPDKSITSDSRKQSAVGAILSAEVGEYKSPINEKDTPDKEPSPEKTVSADSRKPSVAGSIYSDKVEERSKSPSAEKELSQKEPSPDKSIASDSRKQSTMEDTSLAGVSEYKSYSIGDYIDDKEPSSIKSSDLDSRKQSITESIHEVEAKSKSPSAEKELSQKVTSPDKSIIFDSRKPSTADALPLNEDVDQTEALNLEKDIHEKESSHEKTVVLDSRKQSVTGSIHPDEAVERSRSPSAEKDLSRKEPSPDKSIVSDSRKQSSVEVTPVNDDKVKSKSPSLERDSQDKESSPEKAVDSDSRKQSVAGSIHPNEAMEKSKSPSVERELRQKETSPDKSIASDSIKPLLVDVLSLNDDVEKSNFSPLQRDIHEKESFPEKTVLADSRKPSVAGSIHSEKSEERSKSPSAEKEISQNEPSQDETITSASRKPSTAIDTHLEKFVEDSKSTSHEKVSYEKEPSPGESLASDSRKQSITESIQSDKAGEISRSSSAEKEVCHKEQILDESIPSDSRKPSSPGGLPLKDDVEKPKSPSVGTDIYEKEPSPDKSVILDSRKQSIGGSTHSDKAEDRSKSPSAEKEVSQKEPSPEKSITSDSRKQSTVDVTLSAGIVESKSPSIDKDTHEKEPSPDKSIVSDSRKQSISGSIESDKGKDRSKSPSAEKELSQKEPSPDKLVTSDSKKQSTVEVTSSAGVVESQSSSIDKDTHEKEPSPDKSIGSDSRKQSISGSIQSDKAEDRSKSPSAEKELSQKEPSPDKSITSDSRKQSTAEVTSSAGVVESKSSSIDKDTHEKEPSPDKSIGIDSSKQSISGSIQSDNAEDRSKSPSAEKELSQKEPSPDKSITSDSREQSTAEVTSSAGDVESKSPCIDKDTHEKEPSPDKSIGIDSRKQSISGSIQSDKAENRSKSPSAEKELSQKEPSPDKSITSDSRKQSTAEVTSSTGVVESKSPCIDKDTHEKEPSPDKSIGLDSRKQSIAGSIYTDKVEERSKSPSVENEINQKEPSLDKSIASDSRKQSTVEVISLAGVSDNKTPSIGEDFHDKEPSPEKSVVSDSRKQSIVASVHPDKVDERSKSSSIEKEISHKEPSPDKLIFSDTRKQSTVETTSLELISEKSKSSIIEKEIHQIDLSSSNSIVSDRREQSPSGVEVLEDISFEKSFTISSMTKDKDENVGVVEKSRSPSLSGSHVPEKSKSASPVNEKTADERKTSVGSIESLSEDKGKDRSRSHSLFGAADKLPQVRSRAASLYEEKLVEKLAPLECAKEGHTESILEEKELRLSHEKIDELQRSIFKRDVEEETLSPEIKKKIEDHILNEYIMKNKVISFHAVDEIHTTYKIERNLIMKIINDIIVNLNVKRDTVVQLDGTDLEEPSQVMMEYEEHLTDYINDEFIVKKKKIDSKSVDEIATIMSVSRHFVILVIENMIISRKLQRELVVDVDFPEDEGEHHQETKGSPLIARKYSISTKQVEEKDETLISSGAKSDSSSVYEPDHPDSHIHEEIIISESKRIDVENLLMDDYIAKGIKITKTILDQISMKILLPKYIIIEIIEEIIVKKHLSRDVIAEKSIFTDDDFDDSHLRSDSEKTSLEIEQASGSYPTTDSPHYDPGLDKSRPYGDYESPFHKAFMGGMTEIRTTHITTLSGKSTPDFGLREETPDSMSEITSTVTKTITKMPQDSKVVSQTHELSSEKSSHHEASADDTMILTATTQITSLSRETVLENVLSESGHDGNLISLEAFTSDAKHNKSLDQGDVMLPNYSKATINVKQEVQSLEDLIDHTLPEQLEQSASPLIRDLMADDRSYSGKSSPDVSLPKDIAYGGSTGKSTPEISMSPLIRDGSIMQSHFSGRSTPDKRSDIHGSRTSTPEGFRSGEVIRTIITTTRTISDDGEIITTTQEVTEATNDKGETIVIAEKTDVKVDERLTDDLTSDAKTIDTQQALSQSSDLLEKELDPTSPRSDLSSGHSRAATHIWGSSEERHTFSDDEQPSPPISSTPYHTDARAISKETTSRMSDDLAMKVMSSSFYGDLPTEPSDFGTTVTKTMEAVSEQGDYSFRKFTVEKEFAGGYTEKGSKKYIDEADLDFEKALTESQASSILGTSSFTQEVSKPGQSESSDGDSKKDPLADWGSPLGLPSPKAPRKFNLRSPIQPTSSADLSPDSLNFDIINHWGEPMRLPSPAPTNNEVSNKGSPGTPKKEKKQAKKVISENIKNKKRSESPDKRNKDSKNKVQPVYVDLTYVSHHGNSFYTALEFFKKVRARYYVFSGTEPSREVYDALLEAKKTWEDKDLEVTMIPTYDTDTLGYWVADNEEALAAHHIDLSPSASRCTINLQDHETSCSAYRLEF